MTTVRYPQLHDYDWLLEQYVERGRTQTDIADELGTYAATVSMALRRLGIQTRQCGPRRDPGVVTKPRQCARCKIVKEADEVPAVLATQWVDSGEYL